MRFLVFLGSILIALPISRATRDGATAEPMVPAPSLTAILEASARAHRVPAMAAVATRADTIVELAAWGARRDGWPDPVAPSDRFHLGSNTKAMTATLAAILIEEGKLNWTTTSLEVFPEWRDEILADYREVTLADLLAHRAGLPAYDDDGSPEWQEMKSLSGSAAEQRRDFARRALRHAPAVPPRTRRLYSNAGYTVVAAMIERVSGETWEALMRERLFAPLGIRAAFAWPAFDDPRQPWGHYETATGVRPHDPHDAYQLPAFMLPAGGVAMNPRDYARFLQLHLAGLKGRDGLLKSKTIRHLHTAVDGKTALGWGIQDIAGAPASVHNGSAGTFYAVAAIWPSRDLAVAVFANAGDERAASACVEVLKALARRYPVDSP